MSMTCREAQEEFGALIDGDIDDALRYKVNAHLDSCSDCMEEFSETVRLMALCRFQEKEVVSASDADLYRVWRKLQSQQRQFRFNVRKLFVALALAAGLAIVLGGSLFFPFTSPEKRFEVATGRREAQPVPSMHHALPQAIPEISSDPPPPPALAIPAAAAPPAEAQNAATETEARRKAEETRAAMKAEEGWTETGAAGKAEEATAKAEAARLTAEKRWAEQKALEAATPQPLDVTSVPTFSPGASPNIALQAQPKTVSKRDAPVATKKEAVPPSQKELSKTPISQEPKPRTPTTPSAEESGHKQPKTVESEPGHRTDPLPAEHKPSSQESSTQPKSPPSNAEEQAKETQPKSAHEPAVDPDKKIVLAENEPPATPSKRPDSVRNAQKRYGVGAAGAASHEESASGDKEWDRSSSVALGDARGSMIFGQTTSQTGHVAKNDSDAIPSKRPKSHLFLGVGAGVRLGGLLPTTAEGASVGAAAGALDGLVANDVKAQQVKTAQETLAQYNYTPSQGKRVIAQDAQVAPTQVVRGKTARSSIQYAVLGSGSGTKITEVRTLTSADGQPLKTISSSEVSRADGTWASWLEIAFPATMPAGSYRIVQSIVVDGKKEFEKIIDLAITE